MHSIVKSELNMSFNTWSIQSIYEPSASATDHVHRANFSKRCGMKIVTEGVMITSPKLEIVVTMYVQW